MVLPKTGFGNCMYHDFKQTLRSSMSVEDSGIFKTRLGKEVLAQCFWISLFSWKNHRELIGARRQKPNSSSGLIYGTAHQTDANVRSKDCYFYRSDFDQRYPNPKESQSFESVWTIWKPTSSSGDVRQELESGSATIIQQPGKLEAPRPVFRWKWSYGAKKMINERFLEKHRKQM